MSPVSGPAQPVLLPHTWRPFGARIAGTVLGGMLLALCIGVWIAFGAEERARFTPFQKLTLVLIGLLAFSVWFALMRSRVTAAEGGITVVNGYKRRDYEWAEVLGVGLRRGAPWASLDISDGTSVSVMAIQGSDGTRARTAVRELRSLISAPPAS
jgi:hypothetical protein